tara:strand:- start:1131 stop:1316 length:186 start_codon:yes stop_codon:yes gene_type:complete
LPPDNYVRATLSEKISPPALSAAQKVGKLKELLDKNATQRVIKNVLLAQPDSSLALSGFFR